MTQTKSSTIHFQNDHFAMTARFYLRLFTLLFFAVSLQVAFAQKKAVTTKKNTSVKTNNSLKADPPAPKVAPVIAPAAPEPDQYYPADLLYLETGTPIFLETRNELDSKYLEEGKLVCLYVKFPVKVQGQLVIPAGREAWCRINRLIRPKGNGRPGTLEIEPMYIQTDDGQLVTLTGNPVGAYGDDREILSQAIGMGGTAVGQQLMAVYQQRQANRQMELDARIAYQQQQQLDLQQQQQQLAMQQQYMQSQDMQSRQLQMMQQQQLMQQAQMNPRRSLVVMPIAQQDARPTVDPRATYADYSQTTQQPVGNGSVLGAAANPALMGVATALNIVTPFVSILIKGKRAKLPKGYMMKTFVGYGVLLEDK